MKITITIEEANAEVLSALALALRPTDQVVAIVPLPPQPEPAPEPEITEPAPEEKAPKISPERPEGTNQEQEIVEEPGVTPEINEGPATIDQLAAAMDVKLKRTAQLGLENGNAGKGTKVVTEEGEVGVVVATWRGKALVQFTDGRGEVLGAADIALADDRVSGKSEEVVDRETALRTLGSEIISRHGSGGLTGALKAFGVKKISELRPDQYDEVEGAFRALVTEDA